MVFNVGREGSAFCNQCGDTCSEETPWKLLWVLLVKCRTFVVVGFRILKPFTIACVCFLQPLGRVPSLTGSRRPKSFKVERPPTKAKSENARGPQARPNPNLAQATLGNLKPDPNPSLRGFLSGYPRTHSYLVGTRSGIHQRRTEGLSKITQKVAKCVSMNSFSEVSCTKAKIA